MNIADDWDSNYEDTMPHEHAAVSAMEAVCMLLSRMLGWMHGMYSSTALTCLLSLSKTQCDEEALVMHSVLSLRRQQLGICNSTALCTASHVLTSPVQAESKLESCPVQDAAQLPGIRLGASTRRL